jgi:EAL domain-containing protein (putative c-di-GMP-specific phosphodiesterase class I)/CheY-like chemotaxis protein
MMESERTAASPATEHGGERVSVGAGGRGRILLVDDDGPLKAALGRSLARAGFEIDMAGNVDAAARLLASTPYDVVLSDIAMPGGDGLQLLRLVRERFADLPVVLMTGSPELSTAVKAVALGAFDYLVKPVDTKALLETLGRANVLHRLARLKREALELVSGGGMGAADRVGLEMSFDRALASMWIAYQPIVRTSDHSLFGYEALMRSDEKSLPHPGAILDAAERLNRLHDLGRRVRDLAVSPMAGADENTLLFVNLHASDLADDTLLSAASSFGSLSKRIVLEITERASLDHVADARARIASLRELGFRIAVDDLGAGYAGLTSFATLEPEVVKIDMSLVRGVDSNATKQKLVQSVVSLCKDLGMLIVAEGIETKAERDVLVSLGCDLLQGYLLGRPAKAFPPFAWGG